MLDLENLDASYPGHVLRLKAGDQRGVVESPANQGVVGVLAAQVMEHRRVDNHVLMRRQSSCRMPSRMVGAVAALTQTSRWEMARR